MSGNDNTYLDIFLKRQEYSKVSLILIAWEIFFQIIGCAIVQLPKFINSIRKRIIRLISSGKRSIKPVSFNPFIDQKGPTLVSMTEKNKDLIILKEKVDILTTLMKNEFELINSRIDEMQV